MTAPYLSARYPLRKELVTLLQAMRDLRDRGVLECHAEGVGNGSDKLRYFIAGTGKAQYPHIGATTYRWPEHTGS